MCENRTHYQGQGSSQIMRRKHDGVLYDTEKKWRRFLLVLGEDSRLHVDCGVFKYFVSLLQVMGGIRITVYGS